MRPCGSLIGFWSLVLFWKLVLGCWFLIPHCCFRRKVYIVHRFVGVGDGYGGGYQRIRDKYFRRGRNNRAVGKFCAGSARAVRANFGECAVVRSEVLCRHRPVGVRYRINERRIGAAESVLAFLRANREGRVVNVLRFSRRGDPVNDLRRRVAAMPSVGCSP